MVAEFEYDMNCTVLGCCCCLVLFFFNYYFTDNLVMQMGFFNLLISKSTIFSFPKLRFRSHCPINTCLENESLAAHY